jgi:hypothetical protein
VPLSKDPITTFNFWMMSLILFRGFVLNNNSETPYTK